MQKLCVFVDARMARRTGIGRYIQGHVGALCGRQFELIAGVGDDADFVILQKNCRVVERVSYRAPIYSVRERVLGLWGPKALRGVAHVYWYPQYNVPWFLPRSSVVTVHDLIQFKLNTGEQDLVNTFIWRIKARLGSVILRRAVRQAGRVVCVSETTKKDLLEFEPSVATKAVVVGNGVSSMWATQTPAALRAVEGHVGTSTFFLAVGVKKPHKNYGVLLEALDLLAQEGRDCKLVIVGQKEASWKATVHAWQSRGGRQDLLVDLEDVSDELLAAFYARAKALLMPSLYEGFGLPPLEAMVAGTPVVCSAGGALPETVGNAGRIVSGGDPVSWAEAMKGVILDPEESLRLVALGRERSASMSWDKVADKLGEVFSDIASTEVGRA